MSDLEVSHASIRRVAHVICSVFLTRARVDSTRRSRGSRARQSVFGVDLEVKTPVNYAETYIGLRGPKV